MTGRSKRIGGAAAAYVALLLGATAASAAPEYTPITPTMANRTVTLTGHDLTIDQVVQVARYGARVALTPEARQRAQETFELMNEAAAEGVSVYLFNRGAGAGRETVTFTGDPMSAENRPVLEARALAQFRNGARSGYGPEFSKEEIVRAIMLVRANQSTYLPASPGLMQGQIDLLNNWITPVMRTRGGTGEAQGPSAGPINAALVGAGEVYYRGVRMPAAQALAAAGLKTIQPAPGDSTLSTINADVGGMSALTVANAKDYLDWVDLVYAIDLNGMNSSLTPLFSPVQQSRPYPWINYSAGRVLDMLKGSYLLQDDPKRIIQDPESMRAGYVRQGSAWEEWAHLRDAVVIQINNTEHNPVTRLGASPGDSWELSTPQAMKYYVKGSARNNNKHGFIFSNANWDPYPLSNRMEAFTIALANMDVAVMLRQERFRSTFFTVVTAAEVLNPGAPAGGPGGGGGGNGLNWVNHEVWQTIQGLMNPVPPEGYSADQQDVEELDAESLFKVKRADQAIEESWMLLGADLVTGARWMDVRKAQDPSRTFGAAPTAAVAAFRKVVPLAPAPGQVIGDAVLTFLKTTPASTFYPGGPAMPK
ncbi:MAG TPA: aromatic amino acid lyase [Caulobacteraceae bacterium]|jgi:histidine ammonia-lyase|nr:aromatic amino acid lyase [Caulobacteraceae bacterium]